jgi:hypothetical protein
MPVTFEDGVEEALRHRKQQKEKNLINNRIASLKLQAEQAKLDFKRTKDWINIFLGLICISVFAW